MEKWFPEWAPGLAMVFALCLLACQGDEAVTPGGAAPDLFGRFIAVPAAVPDSLPPLPTEIQFFPGGHEFLVLGKAGEVSHYRLADTTIIRLGSFIVPDVAPAPVELGLTGVTFDPNFAYNRLLYMCYATGDNRYNRVIRLRWSENYDAIVQSIVPVIEVDRGFAHEAEHAVYDLCFGNDGYLYVAMGDATQPEFAQDPTLLLGKLLRLNPNRGLGGGYRIPPDNPYLDQEGTRPEIAAFGLRSPFRLTSWGDYILIADVGQNHYEEINVYAPGKANFGWPECEGPCDHLQYRNPVLAISHADPIFETQDPVPASNPRLSIGLGMVYDQPAGDPYGGLLAGRLIYFDVFQGYVRAARVLDNGMLADDQHIFHQEFVTAMDVAFDGTIFGVTLFGGELFRVQIKDE